VRGPNLIDVTPPVKRRPGQHHGDLRNALLTAALELVAEGGPRGLTVAEAARRAGVSVTAPYKHFADRDALLAALGVLGYEEQARRFGAAVASAEDPREQLVATAVAYLDFAVEHRALFGVLFGAGLDKGAHPPLAAAGAAVLDVLLAPAAAVRPDAPEELLVTVAALAHGSSVFLLDGALGPPQEVLPDVRRRVADGARRLCGPSPPRRPGG